MHFACTQMQKNCEVQVSVRRNMYRLGQRLADSSAARLQISSFTQAANAKQSTNKDVETTFTCRVQHGWSYQQHLIKLVLTQDSDSFPYLLRPGYWPFYQCLPGSNNFAIRMHAFNQVRKGAALVDVQKLQKLVQQGHLYAQPVWTVDLSGPFIHTLHLNAITQDQDDKQNQDHPTDISGQPANIAACLKCIDAAAAKAQSSSSQAAHRQHMSSLISQSSSELSAMPRQALDHDHSSQPQRQPPSAPELRLNPESPALGQLQHLLMDDACAMSLPEAIDHEAGQAWPNPLQQCRLHQSLQMPADPFVPISGMRLSSRGSASHPAAATETCTFSTAPSGNRTFLQAVKHWRMLHLYADKCVLWCTRHCNGSVEGNVTDQSTCDQVSMLH